MKTKRRHDLQTNQLADTLAHSIDRVKPYSRVIVGLLLAGVVLGCTYAYLAAQATGKQDRAWDQYIDATTRNPMGMDDMNAKKLDDLIEKSKGTHAAEWARLAVADHQLAASSDQLFSDKANAIVKLHQTVGMYEEALQDAHEPLLRQSALFGVARANEALGELDKAEKGYAQLVSEYPDSPYGIEAKRRVADLQSKSTREFYDWFATVEPEKAADKQPGVPGEKPEFSNRSLDDEVKELKKGLGLDPDEKSPGEDAKVTESKPDAADEKPAAEKGASESKDEATEPKPEAPADKPEAPAEKKDGDEKPDATKTDGEKSPAEKAEK